MTNKKHKIPEKKVKAVSELEKLIKEKRTLLIASIKSIPASQYQEIVKKFRRKAIVKVPKKSVTFRAIENSGEEIIKKLEGYIKESSALLFSDLDAFDLAGELLSKKTPAKAKTGQVALEDLEIQAGPTDLVPGPAISELGALGIQIQIEKGKIHIKEPKIIVKKGEKISRASADIMSKLDMKPFSIGFIPLAAIDTKEKKIYVDIRINKEESIKSLKEAFSKALPFAVEIGYPTKETITFMISEASISKKALERFVESKASEKKDIDSKNELNNQENSKEV
ncbi:50S ribosomal protein L10 [Patescibacteria group bacterium]|nr:50S ribosomal protein L10 [Patescibacteria group bacterium]